MPPPPAKVYSLLPIWTPLSTSCYQQAVNLLRLREGLLSTCARVGHAYRQSCELCDQPVHHGSVRSMLHHWTASGLLRSGVVPVSDCSTLDLFAAICALSPSCSSARLSNLHILELYCHTSSEIGGLLLMQPPELSLV
jgi:hypothetical protein